MVYTMDDLRRIIAPIAAQYGLRAVYVFGSYARGEADADSDIDLLVDLTGTNIRSLLALGASTATWNRRWARASTSSRSAPWSRAVKARPMPCFETRCRKRGCEFMMQ